MITKKRQNNTTKIMVELSQEENRNVEIFKIISKSETKQEAIKKMLNYFKVELKVKPTFPGLLKR